MFRYLVEGFINYLWGWDDVLEENDIEIFDDIEWICYYRNCVCYLDVLEMDMFMFNELVLDLLGVIYDNLKFVRYIFKVY